jgi:hypothetical protein
MRLVEIEDEAKTGGAATRGHKTGRGLLQVHGQFITHVKIHQVCIHRSIDHIQPPKQQEEKNGIVLVLPKLVAIGAQVIIVQAGDESLEFGIDLIDDGIGYGNGAQRRPGLIVVDNGYGSLAFLIPAPVIEIGVDGNADRRIDEGQFPIFVIIDLAQAGKDGGADSGLSRIVLFAGHGVYLVRGYFVTFVPDTVAMRQRVCHTGANGCFAFDIRRDRIVLCPAQAVQKKATCEKE